MEKVHGNEGDLGGWGEPVTEFTVTRREKGEDAEWLQAWHQRAYVCLDPENKSSYYKTLERGQWDFICIFALWHENEVTEE